MDAVKTLESKDGGKTYELPESCIGSATDALSTLNTLMEAESTRSKKRARFKGMVNGNPPWPALMRQKGQADRANFTQREAEGFVSQAKTPYYALFFKGSRFIELTLEYGNADPNTLQTMAGKIATRYQYALDDWEELDSHIQHSQYQMVSFGSGPMVWEDDIDWQSCSRDHGQLLLPDDASAEIGLWETACCARSYLPTQLWKLIKNEKAATDRGWNVEACKKAIMDAAPEDFRSQHNQWEMFETDIRKGVTGWDARSKRILVGDVFQKEFNGKVSHFIVLRTADGKPAPTKEVVKKDEDDKLAGFLFRKLYRYKSFKEITCPFMYDIGPDKQWHSIKGAGPKIFDFCSASDRLFCRMLDGAMKGSGLISKAKDSKSLQEAAYTDVSGGTVVGPGFDLLQQRIAPDLTSPLMAKRELRETLSRNTGQYSAHYLTDEHAPTLGQEQMQAQEQNVLADGDASRYGKHCDRFHRETFRRLLKMGKRLYSKRKNMPPPKDGEEDSGTMTESERIALKFYRNLVELDQIPEMLLEYRNFCSVKAMRLVGNGSTQMRQLIGKELMAMAPMANERGKNWIFRNNTSALANEQAADAIFPAYGIPQQADSHISIAKMENNFLKMPNAEVAISPEQDHVTHFQIHGMSVAEHAQQLQQTGQGDPRALLLHVEQAGQHNAEHMAQLEGDPIREAAYKQMEEKLGSMGALADELRSQIEEAAKAAAKKQPSQGVDPELISKLTKVHLDAKTKDTKMLLDARRKDRKQAFDLQLKDKEAAHRMRTSTAETVNAAQRANFETRHKAELGTFEAENTADLDQMVAAHTAGLENMQAAREEEQAPMSAAPEEEMATV